jgi:hypothetical protein
LEFEFVSDFELRILGLVPGDSTENIEEAELLIKGLTESGFY